MAQKHKSSIGLHLSPTSVAYVEYCLLTSTVLGAGIRQNTYSGDAGYDAACKKNIQSILAVCFDKNPTLVISLPVKQAIIKKLSLDFDETDVRNVIELEMHQHIVGTPENYAIDFMPLTSQAGSNEALKYLAVAYNNSALRRLYSYFGSKHFFGSIVDLDVFALINAFATVYPEYTDRPAMIVHAGETTTTVVVSQHGSYIDSDGFSYTDTILQSPGDYREQLSECLSHLGIACNELSPSVALCYTGKLVASAQLVDVLRVLCPTAFLFEPFRGSHCRASVTNGVTVQQTYELAVAMGLALRGGMEL